MLFQEAILTLMTVLEVKKMEKKNNSKTYLKHGIPRFKSYGV